MTSKAGDENTAPRRDAVVRVPARTFTLGDAISPAVTVEWGRLVPLSTESPAVLWAHGEREAISRFERRAADDETVHSLTPVDTVGGSKLYRVEWASSPLAEALDADDVVVRHVESRDDEWRVRLLSLDRYSLSAFGQRCADREITFTVERLSSTCPPGERTPSGLTAPQREAIQVAREEGYFDIPRRATLDDLGAELGVSRQAVSFRLRRATRRLVEEAFPTGGTP